MGKNCLPHVELAYNRCMFSTTKFLPFEIVYGFKSLTPLDLTSLPIEEQINLDGKRKVYSVRHIHEKIRQKIKKRTEQYAN